MRSSLATSSTPHITKPPSRLLNRIPNGVANVGGGAAKGPVIVAAKHRDALEEQPVRLAIEQLGIPGAHLPARPVLTTADLPACPPLPRKIFRLSRRANQRYQLAPSHPMRGAARDRHELWGEMRWTRTSPTDVRRGLADGEVVWFRRPDAGVKLAPMLWRCRPSARHAGIAPTTETTKPGLREEREGNR